MNRQNKNIILTGFMGCGKTSVGAFIASITGRVFIETDNEIERLLGRKIIDIFTEYGEDYFRDIESKICQKAGDNVNAVISTGGGVIKRAENIEFLKHNGYIVYLSASPSHLYNNLRYDRTRPLLAATTDSGIKEKIERLLFERKELYESFADIIIDATDKSIEEIAKETLLKFI